MAWITALVGAAGSIGAGVIGSKKKGGRGTNTQGIQSNPLFQQLLLQALMGTGSQVSRGQMQNAGPLGTLLGSAGMAGVKNRGQRSFGMLLPYLREAISQGAGQGLSAADIVAQLQGTRPFRGGGGGGGGGGMSGGGKGALIGGSLGGPLGALSGGAIGKLGLDPLGLFGGKKKASAKKGVDVLDRLLAASGYGSLEELVQSELDYSRDAEGRMAEQNETADIVNQGRNDAQRSIAGIQSDFVAPTEAELLTRQGEIEQILRAQIARDFGVREQNALYQANAYGINPAGQLGRLGEGRALAELASGPDALARTLQLLGGQQGLQSNALSALQGSLNGQTALPLQLLGLQSNNNVGLAGIAANQAMNLAQLDAQGNQMLAGGFQGAANQIGAIPGIQAEQDRRRQLDALINRQYGIAPPPSDG